MTPEERLVWLSAFGAYAATQPPGQFSFETSAERCCSISNRAVDLYNEALRRNKLLGIRLKDCP